MKVENGGKIVLEGAEALDLQGWDTQIAYWISQVWCPPLAGIACALLVAGALATPSAWLWAALYLFCSVLVPTFYVVRLVRQGRVSDFHLNVREERFRPMGVALAGSSTACAAFSLGGAPSLFAFLAGINAVQTVVFFAVTLRWKISVHCAAAAGAAVLAWRLVGSDAAPFALSVPLMAWSRVRLRRHTPMQTAAGAGLGGGLMAVALWAFGG